ALADGGGAHDDADRLGDAALFADHTAHIALGHAEVVDDGAVLTGGVDRHLHRVLILDKAAGHGKQQFLHLGSLPFRTGGVTGSRPSSAARERCRWAGRRWTATAWPCRRRS